jgi:hypothetical protein
MAATDPHNNTGVMVAKLFFDMSHLPLFAPEACRSSVPPLRLPESPGALHVAACQHLASDDVIAITKRSIVIAGNDPSGR